MHRLIDWLVWWQLFCGQYSHDGEMFMSASQSMPTTSTTTMHASSSINQSMCLFRWVDPIVRYQYLATNQAHSCSCYWYVQCVNNNNNNNTNNHTTTQPHNQHHCASTGWAIVDTDYSPDRRFLVYSSWSPVVHLCNVQTGREELHQELNLQYAINVTL
jgi:hypothetical protein